MDLDNKYNSGTAVFNDHFVKIMSSTCFTFINNYRSKEMLFAQILDENFGDGAVTYSTVCLVGRHGDNIPNFVLLGKILFI